jgi:hypothetical protein
LQELEERAARFGATIAAESTVPEALDKIIRVRKFLRVRDYQATIVVAAPQGAFLVDEWWEALEGAGLERGDGDLFWLYNPLFKRGDTQPHELFCAEPHSRPGYFHHLDRGTDVSFPDVALHFRVRDSVDPVSQLRGMAQVAEQLRTRLGAVLLTENGQAYELAAAEARIKQAVEVLCSLQC